MIRIIVIIAALLSFVTPNVYAIPTRSILYTKYNINLGQKNYLELVSQTSQTANVKVTIYDNKGSQIGRAKYYNVSGKREKDIDIDQLLGNSPSRFGLIKVELANNAKGAQIKGIDPSGVVGRNSIYGGVSSNTATYGFARELRNPLLGSSYLIVNAKILAKQNNTSKLWLEIANTSSTTQYFGLQIFTVDGREIFNRLGYIKIRAHGENDIDLSSLVSADSYLVRIIPKTPELGYLAGLTSFYVEPTDTKNSSKTHSVVYASEAVRGSGEPQYLGITNMHGECWSQLNSIQIANTSDIAATALVKYRRSNGTLIKTSNVSIPSHSVKNLTASSLLGQNQIGIAEITPTTAAVLVAQSDVKYIECQAGNVQYAYVTGTKRAGEINQLSSFNTQLGMVDYLQVFNVTSSQQSLAVTARRANSLSPRSKTFYAKANGTRNLNLITTTSLGIKPDNFGSIELDSEQDDTFFAQILRQKTDGTKLVYAFPVAFGGLEHATVLGTNSFVQLSGNLSAATAITSQPSNPSWSDLNAAASFSTFVDIIDNKGEVHSLIFAFFKQAVDSWIVGLYIDGGETTGGQEQGLPELINSASISFESDGSRVTPIPSEDIVGTVNWINGATTSTITVSFDPLTQTASPSSIFSSAVNTYY